MSTRCGGTDFPEKRTATRCGHQLGASRRSYRGPRGRIHPCRAAAASAASDSTTWGMLSLAAQASQWLSIVHSSTMMASFSGGSGALLRQHHRRGPCGDRRAAGEPLGLPPWPRLGAYAVRVFSTVPGLVLVRDAVRLVSVCGQPKLDWGDLWVRWVSSSQCSASHRARRGAPQPSAKRVLSAQAVPLPSSSET